MAKKPMTLNTTPGAGVSSGPLSSAAGAGAGGPLSPASSGPLLQMGANVMNGLPQLGGPAEEILRGPSTISSKVIPGAAAAGGGGGAAVTAGVASAAAMPVGPLIAAAILAAPVVQAAAGEAMARIESPDGSFQQYQVQGQGGGSGAAKMGHASIVGALNKAAGTRSRM